MLIGRFSVPQLSIERFVWYFKHTIQWERLHQFYLRIDEETEQKKEQYKNVKEAKNVQKWTFFAIQNLMGESP